MVAHCGSVISFERGRGDMIEVAGCAPELSKIWPSSCASVLVSPVFVTTAALTKRAAAPVAQNGGNEYALAPILPVMSDTKYARILAESANAADAPTNRARSSAVTLPHA